VNLGAFIYLSLKVKSKKGAGAKAPACPYSAAVVRAAQSCSNFFI